MAIGTPVSAGTAQRPTNTSTISTPSRTPAGDALLLAYVCIWVGSNTPPDSIVGSDDGTSWTLIDSTLSTADGASMSLYGCHTSSSPSSDTIDVAYSGSARMNLVVVEVTGVDISGTVANSFEQTDSSAGYGASPRTLTLTGATNTTVEFGQHTANINLSAENTVIDTLAATPYDSGETISAYTSGGDTSPSFSWTGGNAYTAAHAVELKAAAAGGKSLPSKNQYNYPSMNTLLAR